MASDRKIGVALDFSKGSKIALKWAVDNLVRHGDTLYVVLINHSKSSESRNHLWLTTGSRKLSNLFSNQDLTIILILLM